MTPPPVVLALTSSGEAVARRTADAIGAALHGREGRAAGDASFEDAVAHIRELFAAGHPVVGVCAAGILVRAVAPLLSDKRAEPPVIAVAEDGSCAVPLLGGHRGANDLARRIAVALDGVAAVTTAGDLALGAALDAPHEGWALANPEDAGPAMAAALAGGLRVEGPVPFDLASRPDGAVTLSATEAPAAGGSQAARLPSQAPRARPGLRPWRGPGGPLGAGPTHAR